MSRKALRPTPSEPRSHNRKQNQTVRPNNCGAFSIPPPFISLGCPKLPNLPREFEVTIPINAENTENKERTEFTEERKGKRRKKMPTRKIREGSGDGD